MARLPMYEQQTSLGSVRASGQDFGAGVAQAAGELGGVVQDIGVQMKRRQDVIERVQLLSEFDKWAQDSLTTLNDTEDISSAATVEKYSQGLREKANEIIKRHAGTGGSRAELQAQVENQVAQYAKSATAAQVKAQQTMIGNMVDQRANELAINAAFAPDKMLDIFTDFDRSIDALGDALSPQLAAQYKDAGRSRIATSAIQRTLTNGNFTAAKSMLQNPEVGKYLDPDSARRFSIEIAVDEGKQAAEIARQDRNVMAWTQRLGRDLTPDEQMKIRALPEKKDMTVADQIVEYELVTGKPAPQAVIDQFYKVDPSGGGAGGMFGSSLQGRALGYVTENAVAYANGMLPPEQARIYEVMVAEAYKPVVRYDPIRGTEVTVAPTIPQFVQDARNRGAGYYGGMSQGGALGAGSSPPGGTPVTLMNNGQPFAQGFRGPDGMFTAQAIPGATQPGPSPTGAPPPVPSANVGTEGTGGRAERERTIWDRRQNIVGPAAALEAGVNRIPGVGPGIASVFTDPEQIRQADADRQFVTDQSNALVRVLQQNPRFAEGERKAIETEVSIKPEIFRSRESFEAKLEGLSQSLAVRRQNAVQALQADISKEERAYYMDIIPRIDAYMNTMGIPVVPISPDQVRSMPPNTKWLARSRKEVEMLPPGTQFEDRQGNIYTRK